jgi:hypothetical protein
MFFVLPTWQYDCQFYPSFVCSLNAPAEVPFTAIALRIGTAGVLAALAAGAFFIARSPERALATARDLLGRGAGGGSGAR